MYLATFARATLWSEPARVEPADTAVRADDERQRERVPVAVGIGGFEIPLGVNATQGNSQESKEENQVAHTDQCRAKPCIGAPQGLKAGFTWLGMCRD